VTPCSTTHERAAPVSDVARSAVSQAASTTSHGSHVASATRVADGQPATYLRSARVEIVDPPKAQQRNTRFPPRRGTKVQHMRGFASAICAQKSGHSGDRGRRYPGRSRRQQILVPLMMWSSTASRLFGRRCVAPPAVRCRHDGGREHRDDAQRRPKCPTRTASPSAMRPIGHLASRAQNPMPFVFECAAAPWDGVGGECPMWKYTGDGGELSGSSNAEPSTFLTGSCLTKRFNSS